ncbi:MAG: cyclic-di-AMP receptor [Chloroflexi bacterium]|nr:cyclic-di-AMP receptor [Chloroflexota bacterium]
MNVDTLRHYNNTMQALLVVIQSQDTNTVLDRLETLNLPCLLSIASSGGFLREGNTALLLAARPEQSAQVMTVLRNTCHQRTTFVPSYYIEATPTLSAFPIEVEVGGATIFSCEIERFEVF